MIRQCKRCREPYTDQRDPYYPQQCKRCGEVVVLPSPSYEPISGWDMRQQQLDRELQEDDGHDPWRQERTTLDCETARELGQAERGRGR